MRFITDERRLYSHYENTKLVYKKLFFVKAYYTDVFVSIGSST